MSKSRSRSRTKKTAPAPAKKGGSGTGNPVQEVSRSVVDPNALNLYPDPKFWPNLDPDPGLLTILKDKIKTNFRRTKFLKMLFLYFKLPVSCTGTKKVMSPEEIFVSLVSEL